QRRVLCQPHALRRGASRPAPGIHVNQAAWEIRPPWGGAQFLNRSRMLRRSSDGEVWGRLGGRPSEFIRLLSSGARGTAGTGVALSGSDVPPRLPTPPPRAY